MSSYHSSFTYLGQNSLDKGFRIVAFEPDNGEVDTFLDMEQVYTESYDGTKRYLYGLKYNNVATIKITLIKKDGSDFSVDDNRKALRWLTGNRHASWLDFYDKNHKTAKNPVYSFFGSIISVKQYKLDARIVGLTITFESTTPWAYSSPQQFSRNFGEGNFGMDTAGSVFKGETVSMLNIDSNGVLYNDSDDIDAAFKIDSYGVIYNSNDIDFEITNNTDDLYTYTNLDIKYTNLSGNETGNTVTILNKTLNEETNISGITRYEVVQLNSGQFIVSNTGRIFGDNFNFVWPRLRPGINEFSINGSGKGTIEFTFRYPVKIGDCAVDINNIINNQTGCI